HFPRTHSEQVSCQTPRKIYAAVPRQAGSELPFEGLTGTRRSMREIPPVKEACGDKCSFTRHRELVWHQRTCPRKGHGREATALYQPVLVLRQNSVRRTCG